MNSSRITLFWLLYKRVITASQAWSCAPLIPALGRQRQWDFCHFQDSLVYIIEFEVSQSYTVRTCLSILTSDLEMSFGEQIAYFPSLLIYASWLIVLMKEFHMGALGCACLWPTAVSLGSGHVGGVGVPIRWSASAYGCYSSLGADVSGLSRQNSVDLLNTGLCLSF